MFISSATVGLFCGTINGVKQNYCLLTLVDKSEDVALPRRYHEHAWASCGAMTLISKWRRPFNVWVLLASSEI